MYQSILINAIFKCLISISALILLHSCSEDDFITVIDIDIPDREHKLVLLSDLTESRSIVISKTQNVDEVSFDSQNGFEYEVIDDAVVTLSTPDRGDILLAATDSLYDADIDYLPGETYHIMVEYPDHPTLTASTVVPATPDVRFIDFRTRQIDEFGSRYIQNQVELEISDPAGVKNYYRFKVTMTEVWTSSGNDTLTNVYEYFDIGDVDLLGSNYWVDDLTFDGQTRSITIGFGAFGNVEREPISVLVEVQSWPEEKVKYEESIDLIYESEDNPFIEPTILYSNVQGGHGLFVIPGVTMIDVDL